MNTKQMVGSALLLSMVSLSAFADGGREGHGGDAVVCYDKNLPRINSEVVAVPRGAKILSVELLDYWDWSQRSAFKLDLGSSSLSVQDKVDKVLDRYKKIDPDTSEIIKKYVTLTRPVPVTRARLPDIDDSFEFLVTKPNCAKRQLAVQNINPKFGESRVMVDSALYNMLPRDHQVGLILHEAIYGFLLDRNMISGGSSEDVRYLNYIIGTNGLNAANYADFLNENWEGGFGHTVKLATGLREDETKIQGFFKYELKSKSLNFWDDVSLFKWYRNEYPSGVVRFVTTQGIARATYFGNLILPEKSEVYLSSYDSSLYGYSLPSGSKLEMNSGMFETESLAVQSGFFMTSFFSNPKSGNLKLDGLKCEKDCAVQFRKYPSQLSNTLYTLSGDVVEIDDSDSGYIGGQNTTYIALSGRGIFQSTEAHGQLLNENIGEIRDPKRMTFDRKFAYRGSINIEMSYPLPEYYGRTPMESLSHKLHEIKIVCAASAEEGGQCVLDFGDGVVKTLSNRKKLIWYYSPEGDHYSLAGETLELNLLETN